MHLWMVICRRWRYATVTLTCDIISRIILSGAWWSVDNLLLKILFPNVIANDSQLEKSLFIKVLFKMDNIEELNTYRYVEK